MFFDTSLNPRRSVIANIYTAFVETATKMWAYARCMAVVKRPTSRVIVGSYYYYPSAVPVFDRQLTLPFRFLLSQIRSKR